MVEYLSDEQNVGGSIPPASTKNGPIAKWSKQPSHKRKM